MTKFEIDDEGFKTQMSEVPLWRLIQEIISNSFDEKPVKNIDCKLVDEGDRIKVVIIDDGKGFKNVKDIYTLYGDSYKRSNPEQAGRYNEGEKRFLAVAHEGYVETKDVRVILTVKDKIEKKIPLRKGTEVCGIFLKKDFDESIETLTLNISKIAVPTDKKLVLNDVILPPKKIVKKFKVDLYTVKSVGPNQKMVQEKRETDVFLYEKKEDEKPLIYEIGIPVQELEESLLWHVDVRQKIPQTTDRNVVSDRYLKTLYAKITENALDIIPDEYIGSNLVNSGLAKSKDPKTLKEILLRQHGTSKVMIESTVDYRANERAVHDGVKLVQGKDFDPEVRANLKKLGLVKMAGLEYQTNHFEVAKSVEPTEQMLQFANVVKKVALDTIFKEITVNFITTKDTDDLASYGGSNMTWNVRVCGGKSKFNDITNPKMLSILTHELSHDKHGMNNGHAHISPHDSNFLDELERIAGLIESKGIQHWISLV